MTVAELIAELQKLDLQTEVVVDTLGEAEPCFVEPKMQLVPTLTKLVLQIY